MRLVFAYVLQPQNSFLVGLLELLVGSEQFLDEEAGSLKSIVLDEIIDDHLVQVKEGVLGGHEIVELLEEEVPLVIVDEGC